MQQSSDLKQHIVTTGCPWVVQAAPPPGRGGGGAWRGGRGAGSPALNLPQGFAGAKSREPLEILAVARGWLGECSEVLQSGLGRLQNQK